MLSKGKEMQPTSLEVFKTKYAFGTEEVPEDSFHRIAYALAKQESLEGTAPYDVVYVGGLSPHQGYRYREFLTALQNGAIPAGRIASNIGAEASKPNTSLINCTVSKNLPDSIEGIATTLKEAMLTLAKGCGIGYCCSSLRPKDAFVNGVGATTSGSLSFIEIFDTMCSTIASAGGRRGAQMVTMHIWHPDIFEFIKKKREVGKFTQFNMSVLITKEFMWAKEKDLSWDLYFPLHKKEANDKIDTRWISNFPFQSDDYRKANSEPTFEEVVQCEIYQTVRARDLWDLIMESTYNHAEPGVLFIDEINEGNPLNCVETIVATNPSLAKGTLVHTKEGIFPIELLENKQFQVRALDGTWGNATCWLSSEKTKTVSIDFGSSKVIRATPKHKFPVVDRETGSIKRKLVSELQAGDEVPKNLVEPLGIEGDTTLTEEEGFFLGLWLADGSLTVRKTGGYAMYLSFNKQDRDLADRALTYLNSIKINPSAISDRGNEFSIQLTTTTTIEYLMTKLGVHSGVKHIPSIVYTSNDSFIKGFIDGLISGDGHVDVKQSRVTLVNKDKEFILSVAKLLSFMGITGIITESLQTGSFPNGKDYGRLYSRVALTYGKAASQKFASLFSLTCNRKQRALEVIVDNAMKKGTRRDYYLTIANLSLNELEEPVWDISVEHPQHLFPIEWGYTGNCGEQPLPEYGSCLLGSIILSKFVKKPFKPSSYKGIVEAKGGLFKGIAHVVEQSSSTFDWELFDKTARTFVRMLDNVVELHGLALPEQAHEILHKRRHGMGYTGLGTALNLLGIKYGSVEAVAFTEEVTKRLAVINLEESYKLGEEKGCAPIFEDADVYADWLHHQFTQKVIEESQLRLTIGGGMRPRFTHATSIAPTGTLSIAYGNNCSNGIEPSFAHSYYRNMLVQGKKTKKRVEVLSEEAYLWKELHGEAPYPDWFVTAQDITPEEHVAMQAVAQKWIDSSISKTVHIPTETSFEDFKGVYDLAYISGLKGCTTYRPQAGFTAVLQTKESLQNTFYKFTLEAGNEVELCAFDTIWYDGEAHEVENLYCALNQGYYGQL